MVSITHLNVSLPRAGNIKFQTFKNMPQTENVVHTHYTHSIFEVKYNFISIFTIHTLRKVKQNYLKSKSTTYFENQIYRQKVNLQFV